MVFHGMKLVLEGMQKHLELIFMEDYKQMKIKMNTLDFIIINPGALTHTSIAIRDSLLGIGIPFYEVHISNIFSREEFRHKSYFSDIANGVICGLGTQGYDLAFRHIIDEYKDKK